MGVLGVTIRAASVDDTAAINSIYNYYVDRSTATWEHVHTTDQQRRETIASCDGGYPIIVAESAGAIVGFGALYPFRPREGWRPTCEDSVYVRQGYERQGIGRALLADLIRRAREIGYHSMLASISADQEASLALHSRFGFTGVARIPEAGIKFGCRLDCIFMQKML